MSKAYGTILAILFFGTLWGASEAILGGALYAAGVPHASVALSAVAVAVLAGATVWLPRGGAVAAIGCVAAAYRLLNAGPWWCHLCAIVLFAAVFDALRLAFRPERGSVVRAAAFGLVATYLAYVTFAVLMKFAFRHPYWVDGWGKFVGYVGVSGTVAAAVGAVVFPASLGLARRLRTGGLGGVPLREALARVAVGAVTAGLWVVAATVSI